MRKRDAKVKRLLAGLMTVVMLGTGGGFPAYAQESISVIPENEIEQTVPQNEVQGNIQETTPEITYDTPAQNVDTYAQSIAPYDAGVCDAIPENAQAGQPIVEAAKNLLTYSNADQDAVKREKDPNPLLSVEIERDADFEENRYAWVEVIEGQELTDMENSLKEHFSMTESLRAWEPKTILPVQIMVYNEYGEEQHKLGDVRVRLYMADTEQLDGKTLFHRRTDIVTDENGNEREQYSWEELTYSLYELADGSGKRYVEFTTGGLSPFVFTEMLPVEIPAETPTENPGNNQAETTPVPEQVPSDVQQDPAAGTIGVETQENTDEISAPAGDDASQTGTNPETQQENNAETNTESNTETNPENADIVVSDPVDISGTAASSSSAEEKEEDAVTDTAESTSSSSVSASSIEETDEKINAAGTSQSGDAEAEENASEEENTETTSESTVSDSKTTSSASSSAEEKKDGEEDDLTQLPMKEVEEGDITLKSLSPRTRLMTMGLRSVPEDQDPVTEDGMTIEKIRIKWLSKSTGSSSAAGYDTLELAPMTEKAGDQQWQIDFALSGIHEHEAGTIEIVMPAYIWKDRYGAEPGRLTLAVPEDPETGANFNWKRVGDTIVFTNTKNLSAATKVMIQGTFRDVNAVNMVDIDVAPESAYANAEYSGHSDPLYATINLVVPNGNTISMTSNEIDATINTYVEAASASKTAYDPSKKDYYVYWDVPSNMPASFVPANPDDYVYVRWYVTGQAEGCQPFSMTVTDNANDEYGCVILGVQDANGTDVVSPDGQTVTAELFNGYNTYVKSAYVWTAYEKSYFTEPFVIYTAHNTQTISVTGWDDMITTTRDASAEVSIAMPIEYTVVKEWDDNDNERGLRPSYQSVRIWRNDNGNNERTLWKTVQLVENPTPEQQAEGYGTWSYTWSDEGKAWHYETDEPWTASGTFETYYDLDGTKHTNGWHYWLRKKTYDPDTRTWRFVNTFTIDGKYADASTMYKRVFYQYDDPYQRSTRDRALNQLLHDEEAIIPYNVYGLAGTFEHWANNERCDVILEDVLDMINNQRITIDDYDLAYVDIEQPKIYGYTYAVRDPNLPVDDPNRYYTDRVVLAQYIDDLMEGKFYALINSQWVQVGELNGTTLTAMNGATADGMRLNLPANTAQFKEVVNTFGAATELKYAIGVRVKPSEFVLQQINNAAQLSDYLMMTLDNFANLRVEYEGETEQLLSDWDRGYLHGRLFRVAAWQKKRFFVVENDTVAQKLTVHTKATVTQQSNVLNKNDYERAIALGDIPFTNGGVWYDLLPLGMVPDTSSVTLQDGDKLLDAYAIENYKGSGRTLLVIKADLDGHVSYTYDTNALASPFPNEPDYPKEGYKQTQVVEFDCTYDWKAAEQYGLDNVRNTIAFETDDEWIGNLNGWAGETDDPTSGGNKWSEEETRTDTDLMTGLQSTRETPSFIYAGAFLEQYIPDFTAETSIRKWVAVEGGEWSYGWNNEAIVYEGGKYSYRITLESDPDATTKDIIIMDSLENHHPVASSTRDDSGDTQWRGHLRSLDLTGLESAGIAPVVYYSTVPDLDISREVYNPNEEQGAVIDMLQNAVIDGQPVWSTTPPADLEDVTAYAIDCRFKTDGSEFELSREEESEDPPIISFIVNMRAPVGAEAEPAWGTGKGAPANPEDVDTSNPDHNAHAYNNVYLDNTNVDKLGRETHAYIHWDYVKVGIVPFNIEVEKNWVDEDDNDGKRPTSVTVHLIRDGVDTGQAVVLDESNGWHGVFEHILRYDYDQLDDGHYITYAFTEDDVPEYDMSYSREGNNVVVTNVHIPETIDVPFTKTWVGDTSDVRPAMIRVRLFADGVVRTVQNVRADENGEWSGVFKDLRRYSAGHEIVYTVEEERVDDYLASYDGFAITNEYHPIQDLVVEKIVTDTTAVSAQTEFTYTLLLTDKTGAGLMERYEYETSDGRTGRIGHGDTFTLKGGQTITVKDLPTHTRYEVKEDSKKGFTLVAEENTSGELLSGVPARAVFTNKYHAEGRAPVDASKTLTGKNIQRFQFHFEMVEGEYELDSEAGDLLARTANTADGQIHFSGQKFTEVDDGIEYTYTIREVNRGKAGYGYDDTKYIVKITPHDNGDGTMSFTTKYYDTAGVELTASQAYVFPDRYEMTVAEWEALTPEEQEELGLIHQAPSDEENVEPAVPTLVDRYPAVFNNTYHAEGEQTLRSWKQLSGRALQDDEFTFELYDAEGTLLQTKTNIADGSIVWDPISYDEEDVGKTFFYYVKEKNTGDDTVTYDENIYAYSVKVFDNGDGTLYFEEKHPTAETTESACEECSGTGYGAAVSYTYAGNASLDSVVAEIKAAMAQLQYGDAAAEGTSFAYDGASRTLAELYRQAEEILGVTGTLPESNNARYVMDTTAGTIGYTPACAVCNGTGHVQDVTGFDKEGDELALFKNSLKPGSLTITKETQFDPADEPDPDQTFHFKVKFAGFEDEELSLNIDKPRRSLVTVTYNGKGGHVAGMEDSVTSDVVEYRLNTATDEYETDAAGMPSFEYVGHTLLGWYEDEDYLFKYADAGAALPDAPDDDMEVYAKWDIQTFDVTFHMEGGVYNGADNVNTEVPPQTVEYGSLAVEPNRANLSKPGGETFVDWYTDSAKTIKYDFSTPVTADLDLYAKWKTKGVSYAVSLYGIGVTQDAGGNAMGLTFGPALGADYINSYKSHTPSGTTGLGNEHRCIHNDDWETIIHWNSVDPDVYEQCIAEGCTHAVELDKTATTTVMNRSFNATYTGDGPSMLFYELMQTSGNYENLRWHPHNNMPGNSGNYGTNYKGWGATRIRAMLNGADELTDLGDDSNQVNGDKYSSSASSDVNKSASVYTASNCLFAAFPEELQNAIGETAVKYDSVYNSKTEGNLKTSYDKLWLLSPNEIWLTTQNTSRYHTHPLEGTQFPYFAAKSNLADSDSSQNGTMGYRVSQFAGGNSSGVSYFWLRSSRSNRYDYALYVYSSGSVNFSYAYSNYGVSPCFSLSR